MKKKPPRPADSPPSRWPYVVAGICYAVFIILAVLVQARALSGFDRAMMQAKYLVANPVLDLSGEVAGVLFSAEGSVVMGVVMAYVLWRKGLGVWSLAPLAFVLLVPIEFAMKYLVNQPLVPEQFRHVTPYPLTQVPTPGAFPSGHALRTAFLATFLAVLIYTLRRDAWRWTAGLLLLLALFVGYTRMYVGDHWLSDVIAGLLLGGGTAVLAAWPVATRLREP